jgi:hypothetical protein
LLLCFITLALLSHPFSFSLWGVHLLRARMTVWRRRHGYGSF